MSKYFIITVDTEGDNQWAWKPGSVATTYNTKYLPRFQLLCEKYGFAPVYLTDYEMIMDDAFCDFARASLKRNVCEIGMHIHAWNSPPAYKLNNTFGGCPFITEYPVEVMREKLIYLKNIIENKLDITCKSFRSGRWATNQELFEILNEIGILIDCSITPQISNYTDKGMSVAHGNDYSNERLQIKRLTGDLIEIPMSTSRIHTLAGSSLKNRVKNTLKGKEVWLRPAVNTSEEMLMLIKHIEKLDIPYLEFMIHSTELMPGGSPYTVDETQIERLYKRMDTVFEAVSKSGYQGITLHNYYELIKDKVL